MKNRKLVALTIESLSSWKDSLNPVSFLGLFADWFGRREGRSVLAVYVQGQLSDLHRKTAEAIRLRFKTAPRTLQRFLESIKWDEERLRQRCQQIVANKHADPEAIGAIDESAVAKSSSTHSDRSGQWHKYFPSPATAAA